MRRVPEPIELSEVITTGPISAVAAHVRAAAELFRIAGNVDHAHLVAVLLAEEHHRSQPPRLLDRDDVRAHGQVLEDRVVHASLDLCALLCR